MLHRVLEAVQAGVPPHRVAAALGIDPGLARLALDHWIGMGVIVDAKELGLACATCPPPEAQPIKCKGCPFG